MPEMHSIKIADGHDPGSAVHDRKVSDGPRRMHKTACQAAAARKTESQLPGASPGTRKLRGSGCQSSSRITNSFRGPWTPSTRESSMSLVAEPPLIHVMGLPACTDDLRRCTASGTSESTLSAVTTHT